MKYGYTINNKLMANSNGNLFSVDPYNPLNLPQGTIRVRTNDGQPPVSGEYNRATLVEGTTDVYDVWDGGDEFLFTLENATNVIEVLGANAEGKRRLESTFRGCTALSSIPSFDTSKVTSMRGTFQDCSSLLSAPFLDTSKVESMGEAFKDCASLTSVPLYDTSKLDPREGLMHTFINCKSLTSVPLFDTSNFGEFNLTFSGCTSLVSVPLFDTSNVTDMAFTFKDCSSLSAIPLFNTSKLIRIDEAFENCVNVQSGALALYQQITAQHGQYVLHNNTFKNCGINTETGSAELAQIPDDWK